MTGALPLAGRVAVVTGASRGIGRAIAERLVADGATVATVAEVAPPPLAGTTPMVCDLSVREQVDALLPAVRERLGDVDVLVNNAGIAAATPVVGLDPAALDRVLEVNLRAPVLLMAAAAAGMAERGWGRIVNVTSIHGRFGEPGSLAYDIAKAGLDQATRTAAVELGPRGVLANAVAPGFVDTAMAVAPDGVNELESDAFRTIYVEHGRIPLRRAARPEEIAVCAGWLASPANTYLTGQVLTADGGMTSTF